jgi:predicted permease
MQNLTVAVRALGKQRGFTLATVGILAVGIGANAALFSVYDQLVLNPLSVPAPSSLVALQSRNRLNVTVPNVSWPRYEEIRAHARSFERIGISAFDSFTLTEAGEPEQLNGQRIDVSFLPTLGIPPAQGRNFAAEEDAPNGPAVCIITHELWQTRFGGRADMIGRTITLNGQPWQVVGIMPPRLSIPFSQVHVFVPRVFEITGLTAAQIQAGALYAQAIARLKPGVSLAQARTELAAINQGYKSQYGGRLDADAPTEAQGFRAALVGSLTPTFNTLLAAVGFVLLIACANVASLFLGRLAARQREIAVRQSLGATRGQIVAQFMTESLVFAGLAGVLGTLGAIWAVTAMQSMAASQLPPNTELSLNWRALVFTAGVTAVSAVLVGLAPAWQASHGRVVEALKDGARGSTRRGGRIRHGLIVAEVALSVVLLVASTLLLVSFLKMQQASPGFDPAGGAAAVVNLPALRYASPAQQTLFYEQVMDELRADRAVTHAAVATGLPLGGFGARSPYGVGGRPHLPLPQRPLASLNIVGDDYFAMLSIPIVEGRAFTGADRPGAPNVCIINESLANRLFPGESALGHTILRGRDNEISHEIVGVIRDVRSLGIGAPAPDEIYHPFRQQPRSAMAVAARTEGDPSALQAIINRAVRAVDKDQPTRFFATFEANVAASLGTQRMTAALTTIFAAIALLLSGAGLYSVLSHAVAQRTAEIGLRMALGAQRSQVVGLVLRGGLTLVAIGMALGLAAAAGASRLIAALLFGVAPLDPLVYAAVSVLFAVVAVLACWLPSRRAARIDPIVALAG